jgi:hypothetical protein
VVGVSDGASALHFVFQALVKRSGFPICLCLAVDPMSRREHVIQSCPKNRQIKQIVNIARAFLVTLASLLFFVTPALAEEWRGIVPGKSTKADVVKLFPECSGTNKQCELTLTDEDVFITFSSGEVCSTAPENTVLAIDRDLNPKSVTLADTMLNLKRFRTFDPASDRKLGYKGYIDDRSGLAIMTVNKSVIRMVHFANRVDSAVCMEYYQQPKSFVTVAFEHYLYLRINCPKSQVVTGESIEFVASYFRGDATFIIWNVSAGKIVGPSNRRRMILDTSDVGEQTIRVSAEITKPNGQASMEECKVEIVRKQ